MKDVNIRLKTVIAKKKAFKAGITGLTLNHKKGEHIIRYGRLIPNRQHQVYKLGHKSFIGPSINLPQQQNLFLPGQIL